MAVVIHKDGKSYQVTAKRMYGSHGPWLLGQFRLDRLQSASVLQDSSTVTSYGTSHGKTTTDVGGQVIRSVAGAVIGGAAGAIVGGGGAPTRTVTNTVTHESLNLNVFMNVQFKDEKPFSVQVTDETTFQLIMASVGQPEWTQERLNQALVSAKRATADALREKQENVRARSSEAKGLGSWLVVITIGALAALALVLVVLLLI